MAATERLPVQRISGWRLFGLGIVACLLPVLFSAGCESSVIPEKDTSLTFVVIDVGQGLSQIIEQENRAILFDAGPPDSGNHWKQVYRRMGSPYLSAIVISHRDLDHSGGLRFLDASVDWSGRLVTGKWEDTSRIRSCCSDWDGPIVISTIADGDTVYFFRRVHYRLPVATGIHTRFHSGPG